MPPLPREDVEYPGTNVSTKRKERHRYLNNQTTLLSVETKE